MWCQELLKKVDGIVEYTSIWFLWFILKKKNWIHSLTFFLNSFSRISMIILDNFEKSHFPLTIYFLFHGFVEIYTIQKAEFP